MRCVVTGADGFLGAHLCRRLLVAGHEVTGAALNRRGETSLDALGVRVRVEYGDVTDAGYIERLLNAYEAEWVFHLAGVSIVRIADANPARAIITNTLGTLNVLEAARQQRTVKAVVVASSDKAYGDAGGKPYTEDMPLRPTGAYETSKASADLIAQAYGRQYGVPVTVARCANLYGAADLNWSRLVPNACRLAVRGLPPFVHPSAWTMRREFISVDDAVSAYILLAGSGARGEAYNVGSGRVHTPAEVACRIARYARAPEPTDKGEAHTAYEIPSQCLDSSKLEALGWRPSEGECFETTLGWYRGYLLREWAGV